LEKKKKKFSIKKRAKSFRYAFNGLKVLISEEHNSRIHLLVSFLVVVAGFYFKVSQLEWIGLILCIGFVLALEIINSAIENLADFIEPNNNTDIKKIKDLAAAAVLVGSITSAIVGLIVLLPKVINTIV
jgi:undecaprenol kinase/diacylglycerol kinase (ATP)